MSLQFSLSLLLFLCLALIQAYGQLPLNGTPNTQEKPASKDSILNPGNQYQNGKFLLKVGTRDKFYKEVKTYHPNGKIDYTRIIHGDANLSDPSIDTSRSPGNYWWYKDGKPKEQGTYTSNRIESAHDTSDVRMNYLIQSFWDSTGIQQVKEGNGQWYDLHSNGHLKIKGNYVNGLPDGEWVGYYENGKPYFIEQYKDGKLIRGKCFSIEEKKFTYTIAFTKPEYKGGTDKLMQFLTDHIRYPKEAQQKGDQGTVFMEIMINEVGKVINPTVIKGVSPECDAEALRVVSQMPDWKPGLRKGQPVGVKYVLPIHYTLEK